MTNANQQGADAKSMAGRWLNVSRTLCFVTHGADVLLMKRAESRRIFPGRYNGLGGHIERGEDPLRCAQREISEESGLYVPLTALRLRGVSAIDAGQASGIMLFIFTVAITSRLGTITECPEGTLHWVPIDQVRDLPLVDDLPILWPRLFPDQRPLPDDHVATPFFAQVSYDSQDQLIMRFSEEIG
jgi:8-oxo-dGTP diphosphatase